MGCLAGKVALRLVNELFSNSLPRSGSECFRRDLTVAVAADGTIVRVWISDRGFQSCLPLTSAGVGVATLGVLVALLVTSAGSGQSHI